MMPLKTRSKHPVVVTRNSCFVVIILEQQIQGHDSSNGSFRVGFQIDGEERHLTAGSPSLPIRPTSCRIEREMDNIYGKG